MIDFLYFDAILFGMKAIRSTVTLGINMSTRRHNPKRGPGSYNRRKFKNFRHE